MLTDERKTLILAEVARSGRLIAKDFSKLICVSEDTIRRDLRELAAANQLQRVYGGALPASPTTVNLTRRRSMAKSEKLKLAQAAAKLITPGQSIFLDGGSTNQALVKALPLNTQATIFTHSPTIAASFESHHEIEVILIGGRLFRHSMVSVGTVAAQAIAELHIDLFFLGVTGLQAEAGLTTGDYEEAAIKRTIISRAAETITLATQEKLGAASAHRIADLSSLSTLVISQDAQLPDLAHPSLTIIRA